MPASLLGTSLLVASLLVASLIGCASSDDAGEVEARETSDAVTRPATVEASPSAGCDQPATTMAGSEERTIDSGGAQRVYRVQIPEGATEAEPQPLIMNIHGAFSNAAAHTELSGFSELADDEGFVLVAPQANLSAGGWSLTWALTSDGADVQYLFDLLDEIESTVCIDTNRVFLAGFSQGAVLSLMMGCREPERFAAIASVAGFVEVKDCEREAPVAVVAVHGIDDDTIGFDGTIKPFIVGYTQGPAVPELAATWARANDCPTDPVEDQLSERIERISYNCGAPVDLYAVTEGGHAWPGAESEPDVGLEATEVIWEFFQRQTPED